MPRPSGLWPKVVRRYGEHGKVGPPCLVLEAVTGGDAARMYERLGWVRVGDVPRFALMPDGNECGTTYDFREG